MSKFNRSVTPIVRTPITTTAQRVRTFEGGIGYARDAKSDLFLLAISNMVREDTAYEGAGKRDERFISLIRTVTAEDPEWVAKLVPWLRDVAQMRSASLVLAAEYVAAGGPLGRGVISAACQRADEPAEMIGYWHANYGRSVPAAVKRGVADAVTRLYNERSSLRNDGVSNAYRFADIIELVHPTPSSEWQSALFKYLLDARHHDADITEMPAVLPVLYADYVLSHAPKETRRALTDAPIFARAGWSWERLSGWLPDGMDAAAWESVIPQMGYMALLRNLRNFDQAKISDAVAAGVIGKLTDPAEVARSRQFPIRFLSAYREVQSLRWAYALEQALDLSLQNVPVLPGKTLVLVDLSGSMWQPISGRSKRDRWEVALTFGAALAKRAEYADLVLFGTDSRQISHQRPLLKILEQDGRNLGSTETMAAVRRYYAGHDRIVILTDEQAHDAGLSLPSEPTIFTFNVAGYAPAQLPSGTDKRFTIGGGLTDACFRLIPIVEARSSGTWPHLA